MGNFRQKYIFKKYTEKKASDLHDPLDPEVENAPEVLGIGADQLAGVEHHLLVQHRLHHLLGRQVWGKKEVSQFGSFLPPL